MKKARTYKSDAFAAIHQTACDMHDAGSISKQTMRQFDETCHTPLHNSTPEEIKALRNREEVSWVVFAHYLNVTKESVSQWERCLKKPAGVSQKLLFIVKQKGLRAIA